MNKPMKPVSKRTARLRRGLAKRVVFGLPKCEGDSGFVLSSATMSADPPEWTEIPHKLVRERTVKDVERSFAELRYILLDLEAVALRHPANEVAIHAQATLADVAGLILRTWPAVADQSVQPLFRELREPENGALRQRWALLHGTGGSLEGPKKSIFSELLLLYNACWGLGAMEAISSAAKLRPNKSLALLGSAQVARGVKDIIELLRKFYQFVDGLTDAMRAQPQRASRLARDAQLQYFDDFWEKVCKPFFFNGKPSRWQMAVENNPFNGNKAPSKSEGEFKKFLLNKFRNSSVGIVSETSVDT